MKSNKSAIGARITAIAEINGEHVQQIRELTTNTGGYTSGQSSLVAHFGFGNATKIDTLLVRWPLRNKDVYTNVEVNQFLILEEQDVSIASKKIRINDQNISIIPAKNNSFLVNFSSFLNDK